MATRVVMDPAKLAELLRGPNGPVMRRLIQDGEYVKDRAKSYCRVYKPTPGPARKRRPGTLRDSIVKRIRPGGIVEVGSEDDIALIEEKGSNPHKIKPRSSPRLVFWSAKFGKVVYLKPGQVVDHPGTTGSRYLSRALADLRSRY